MCLIVSHSRIFHSYGKVTITGEGLQILTYARLSCQLSCLFVWDLSSRSRICHSYGDVTIAGEGLQILTNVWPLSSEGSLACHTYRYCDTLHPFIMVISEDSDTHTYCQAFSSGAVTTCFYDLGLSRLGFEHPTFRLRGQRSSLLRHRRGFCCV